MEGYENNESILSGSMESFEIEEEEKELEMEGKTNFKAKRLKVKPVYHLAIEEHPKLDRFIWLVGFIMTIGLYVGCGFQIVSLIQRYISANLSFNELWGILPARESVWYSNSSVLYEPFPSVTICAPDSARESLMLNASITPQILNQLATASNQNGIYFNPLVSLFDFSAARTNPNYLNDWILVCSITPKIWPEPVSTFNSGPGCDPKWIETIPHFDFYKGREACLTFRPSANLPPGLMQQLKLVLIMGPNMEITEFGAETNLTNPDLVNKLIESTTKKVSVAVQSQLESPNKPIGSVANPNRMYVTIGRSINRIESDPFLPGLNIAPCIPGKATELSELTRFIWTGSTFVNFSYAADFCMKLRAQKRVADQCGCLSDVLPVNQTLYQKYPLCRSFKDVISSGFTNQSFAILRNMTACLDNLMSNSSSPAFPNDSDVQACPAQCSNYILSQRTTQDSLPVRLTPVDLDWLRSRILQLQSQLGSRSSLAYDAFLNNLNYYILPQAGLANFLEINIALLNEGGTQISNGYEYSFDYLLADLGGTLGLWVDWTVIGFFEDLDHYTGGAFLIFVTVKSFSKKIIQRKATRPTQEETSDETKIPADSKMESETCTTRC